MPLPQGEGEAPNEQRVWSYQNQVAHGTQAFQPTWLLPGQCESCESDTKSKLLQEHIWLDGFVRSREAFFSHLPVFRIS